MSTTVSSASSVTGSFVTGSCDDWVTCTGCKSPIRGECGVCPPVASGEFKPCACCEGKPVQRYTSNKRKQCFECHSKFPICIGGCGLPQEPGKFCRFCAVLAKSSPAFAEELLKKKAEQRQKKQLVEVQKATENVVSWEGHLSQCIAKLHTASAKQAAKASADSDEEDLSAWVKSRKSAAIKNKPVDLATLTKEVEKARKGLSDAKDWLVGLKPAVQVSAKPVLQVSAKPSGKAGVVKKPVIDVDSTNEFPALC